MKDPIVDQLIIEDIRKIVAREVKDLRRKKENLTVSEISTLEKFAKIAILLQTANTELMKNLPGLSDEELDALSGEKDS